MSVEPIDLAAVKGRHYDESASDRPGCAECSGNGYRIAWPCDTYRALDVAERLAEQIAAVLAMHENRYDEWCSVCDLEYGWPCPTVKTLGGQS